MKFKIIANKQTPKSGDFSISDRYVDKLFNKFISFAMRQHNCVGLAANQVSCNGMRIMLPFFAIKFNYHWDIVVSPEILKYKGKKEEKIETCLTWIGKNISVKRNNVIMVRYLNMKGERIERIITGFEAQIWQHEYNHLMGIEEKFIEDGVEHVTL